jgi:hypothetical protein
MMGSAISSSGEDDGINKAAGILGEHFQNYAIVVQYDDGQVWHQGNNDLIEKALYREALEMIQQDRDYQEEDLWIEEEEEEEEAGDDWFSDESEE